MAVSTISTPQVSVNAVTAPIVPESFKYTEGFGEQNYQVESSGGGSVSPVIGNNVSMHYSTINWEMFSTNTNIETIRLWKGTTDGLTITATDQKTGLTRSFNGCILTSNYEVGLASEGKISLEFKGQQSS